MVLLSVEISPSSFFHRLVIQILSNGGCQIAISIDIAAKMKII